MNPELKVHWNILLMHITRLFTYSWRTVQHSWGLWTDVVRKIAYELCTQMKAQYNNMVKRSKISFFSWLQTLAKITRHLASGEQVHLYQPRLVGGPETPNRLVQGQSRTLNLVNWFSQTNVHFVEPAHNFLCDDDWTVLKFLTRWLRDGLRQTHESSGLNHGL